MNDVSCAGCGWVSAAAHGMTEGTWSPQRLDEGVLGRFALDGRFSAQFSFIFFENNVHPASFYGD
ncbi:MAG: hypothetical protein ACI4OC_01240, partial [Coriobacteriales bacterium]